MSDQVGFYVVPTGEKCDVFKLQALGVTLNQVEAEEVTCPTAVSQECQGMTFFRDGKRRGPNLHILGVFVPSSFPVKSIDKEIQEVLGHPVIFTETTRLLLDAMANWLYYEEGRLM